MQGIDIRKLAQNNKEIQPTVRKRQSVDDASIWSFLNKDIKIFSVVNAKVKEAFYHDLSVLIQAGVDLKSALDLLVAEQKKKEIRFVMTTIRDEVVGGGSLSTALQKQKHFTPYEFYSIQIGEETGRLVPVLDNLAQYFKKQIKQRRQIVSAMMYPSMVTLTSLGAVFFMLNFIVPMFADIFQRTGNDLPAVTKFIVDASAFLKRASLPSFLVLLAGVIYGYSQRSQPFFRKISSTLILKIPLFGEMIRKIYVGRLCNSMALLVGAKVSLIRSIQLSKQMVGFYPIETSLQTIEEQILHGKSLNNSLAEFAIYDTKMVSLIKVGEEVNELGAFFGKIAQQYNDDIEHQSALLSSILEPFIIIFLGFFVGLILIAMYLPMFQLGNGFE